MLKLSLQPTHGIIGVQKRVMVFLQNSNFTARSKHNLETIVQKMAQGSSLSPITKILIDTKLIQNKLTLTWAYLEHDWFHLMTYPQMTEVFSCVWVFYFGEQLYKESKT